MLPGERGGKRFIHKSSGPIPLPRPGQDWKASPSAKPLPMIDPRRYEKVVDAFAKKRGFGR